MRIHEPYIYIFILIEEWGCYDNSVDCLIYFYVKSKFKGVKSVVTEKYQPETYF